MKSIYFIALLAILLSTVCFASTTTISKESSWKTECIGRYQIDAPGEIEVALDKLSNTIISPHTTFLDGQVAYFSQSYYYGSLIVTTPTTLTQFIKFKQAKELQAEKIKQEFMSSSDEKKINWGKAMKPMAYNNPSLFGWDLEDSYPALYHYLENRIYIYSPSHGNDVLRKKQFHSVLNDLRPRPLYEIPNQTGVCIPYGFIADDGDASSDIAVTMRLIDHPDVEIFFEDGAPARDPKMAITLFFDGYVNGEKGIKADFWGYRSITMSGQKGKALFVTITRTDDTKDYGYVAYVEGDSASSSKMLYVIRTAARAKGEPVSKDELKDMAEKIMASVKPHGVK